MRYLVAFSLCAIMFACKADDSAEGFSTIGFPVIDACVADVDVFLKKLDKLEGFIGDYYQIDYDAGIKSGVAGYAVIGSKYETKEALEAYVNGAVSDCAPKRKKIVDIYSTRGFDDLKIFLELRRLAGDNNIHFVLKDGLIEISF